MWGASHSTLPTISSFPGSLHGFSQFLAYFSDLCLPLYLHLLPFPPLASSTWENDGQICSGGYQTKLCGGKSAKIYRRLRSCYQPKFTQQSGFLRSYSETLTTIKKNLPSCLQNFPILLTEHNPVVQNIKLVPTLKLQKGTLIFLQKDER